MSESTVQGAVAPGGGATRLLSDSRLTRRAVDGDQRAFAAIFRRYHQDLYRYCMAILRDPQDAQDALQNTMVKVLGSLPGEKREIQLKPWLYRIAHNEAIDLRRAQRPTEALESDIPVIETEPGEVLELRTRMRTLLSDLEELPERQRGALVMRELSGLSFEQIAATFGTSAAVVRQTAYEARLSLQRMSEGREMDCTAVTKALSDGDGRLSRRRELRAHLRSCEECRRFADGLRQRERDLAMIAPMPAVVATGLLQGVIGAGAKTASGGLLTGVGVATGKTVAGSVVAKSAATVAVMAAVGVAGADRAGLVNLDLPGAGSDTAAKTQPAAPAGQQGGVGHSSSAVSSKTPGAAKAGKQRNAKPVQAGKQAGAGKPPTAGKPKTPHGKGNSGKPSRGEPQKGSSQGQRGKSQEKKPPAPSKGAKANGAGSGAGAQAKNPPPSSKGSGSSANGKKAPADSPATSQTTPPRRSTESGATPGASLSSPPAKTHSARPKRSSGKRSSVTRSKPRG